MEINMLSYIILPFLFFFILITLSKNITRSKTDPSSLKLPPGPRKLPFIGNLHNLVLSPNSHLPHHRLRDLATKYGPVLHLQLGQVPTVIISSPETAKEVLKTHNIAFASRPPLLAAEILFYGRTDMAFSPYGPHWRHMRKISTLELLSTKRVQYIRPVIVEEVGNLCKWIGSNSGFPINFTEKVISTTYDIMSRSMFGEKTKEGEVFVALLKEAMEVLGGFNLGDLYPSIKWIHVISGFKRKIERIHKELDRMLEDMIQKRMLVSKNRVFDGKKKQDDDLLDVLLRLHDSDLEEHLTMQNVKAVLQDLFLGGTETSTTTVVWAMAEMLKNPRVLSKVQDEVRHFFDDKGGPNFINVQSHLDDELKYLKSVEKETLRMHPPASLLLPRECREDCQISGYHISTKTRVMINVWAISRDQKYWEDGQSFIPERFMDGNLDYKGGDFRYLPFGSGRRICPGISFGIANVEIPLALLLYHFNWDLPGGMNKEEIIDMTEDFGLSVRKKDMLYLIPTIARSLPTEFK